jgi:hypothetical protein
VISHCRLAGIWVTRGQRLDDQAVLMERAVGPARLEDGAVLKPDALALQVGDQSRRHLLICDRPYLLVEAGVQLRIPERVPGLDSVGHLAQDASEIEQIGRRHPHRRLPCQHLLEGDPYLLDLKRLAIRDQAHARAPVRLPRDEALLVEPDKGGADGGPAGAEHSAQVRFDQALVGLKAPGDDPFAQAPVDLQAVPRRRLASFGAQLAIRQIIPNNVDNPQS